MMSETNTNPEARDELIDRAISDEIAQQVHGDGSKSVESLNVSGIRRTIIAALAAEGMVIVPKEPTGAMNKAAEVECASWWTKGRQTPVYGHEPAYLWAAMLAALPTPTLPPAGDER